MIKIVAPLCQKIAYASSLCAAFSTRITVEPAYEPYETMRQKQFTQCMQMKDQTAFEGFYTQEGAAAFQERHKTVLMKPLISDSKIKVSSIGVGTYRGSLDETDDILQFNGIVDSVLSGVNVIDTCSNFRGGRSEMSINSALQYLFRDKGYNRSQIFIQTKAGYVKEDLPSHLSAQIINDHCVHPTYLQLSLNKSLDRLGIKNIDVFYLNNFAQSQLSQLKKDKFEAKLAKAFEFMEKSRQEGKIKYYGMSSWESFRVAPTHPNHLSLKSIAEIAQKVGGADNGFQFLQIPINLMMPESFAEKNQEYGSLLETAEALKINIVSSSPLLSGSLINIPLPASKVGCRHNGAKHLQIIRSIPSPALVCSLIGQKTNRHVKKNLQVLETPPLSEEQWFRFFIPEEKPNEIAP